MKTESSSGTLHNNNNDSIKEYIEEVMEIPALSAAQERELALRIQQYDDLEAKELLKQSGLRLVIPVAQSYFAETGFSLLELIEEGNRGLANAVEKYNWKNGYRFSSYAVWWIKRAIENRVAHPKAFG
jgi:RNA polymerase primary sigma factor